MARHRRRGRKPRHGARRKPCGRIIQPKPDEVAIEARMRILGLSRIGARTREAGHALGVPFRQKKITRAQFEAGLVYLEARERYRKAILSPKTRSTSDFDDQRGSYSHQQGAEPAYTAFVEGATARYQKMRREVLLIGPLAMMCLEAWIDHSDMLKPLPMSCLEDYRLAANVICKIVGIEEKDEKKGG